MGSNSAGGCFLPGDPPPSSNQVITTPNILFNVAAMTATGATGTDATPIMVLTPALITITGASGAGVAFPTGAAVPGTLYAIKNLGTGATKVYAVGGSINGTTGTTAYTMTVTGTAGGFFMCVAAGAWQVLPLVT